MATLTSRALSMLVGAGLIWLLSAFGAASASTPGGAVASGSPLPSIGPSASPTSAPSLKGCVPECLAQNAASIGPVAAGPYTTLYFLDKALTLTYGSGWTVLDDTTNEFISEHPAPNDWLFFVWVDPYPVEHLTRVPRVDRTAAEMIAAWQQNPALIVTPGPDATIGDGIPATTVDLQVSDAAPKEAPDCPDLCTNFIGFENGPDAHGIFRGENTRMYFAPVSYGGQTHLMTLSVEVIDAADFDAVLPDAQQLIATLRMPVEAAVP